ncbi:xanthan lyase, partial [bacterium]|nr:xanthan lyase [bacterium]
MDFIYNMWIVAKFETKTLLRSWFFRIFALLAIIILALLDLVLYTNLAPLPWSFRGIPSSIPYTNILFLNLVQAVIAVFLSSDFLKRDKNLDTTEVVYTKSISNLQYVAGKTAGILFTFFILNVAVLIVAAVYNIFFANSGLSAISYLLYPLVISLPTIVFILGLSFLLMVLIRNQAVTFILLLGYIAATLFYLSSKFNHLFDYLGFNIPLMYSGITGFGNVGQLLVHRGIYLFLGISFIFITSIMLKRLPQSKVSSRISILSSGVFLILALLLSFVHVTGINKGEEIRKEIVNLNNSLENLSTVRITECRLDVTHKGDKIEAEAFLKIINSSNRPVPNYIFSLNPGLKIEELSRNGKELDFKRNLHLIFVTPEMQLQPLATDSLLIKYSGAIDENACYPDIDPEVISKNNRIAFMNVKKRYSFISSNYLLLTPETHWYPVSDPGFSDNRPVSRVMDFTLFNLDVKTRSDLVAISQGKPTSKNAGVFTFNSETPLPGLSLVIGDYEKRSVTADSVSYNLYTIKGDDYFSEYFDSIKDTLPELIREEKQNYENSLELSCPYSRISLVEVPIQFCCYNRFWTLSYEAVQPEMVLLHEKGVNIRGGDFRRMTWRTKRINKRRNETTSDIENQTDMFKNFVSQTLAGELNSTSLRRGPESTEISYSIFPFYYNFINHIESKEWPALNIALESYLSETLESPPSSFLRFVTGISDEEKANIELSESSLAEILKNPEKRDITRFVISLKGKFLFNLLANKIGEENLKKYIKDITTENSLPNINSNEVNVQISNRTHPKHK